MPAPQLTIPVQTRVHWRALPLLALLLLACPAAAQAPEAPPGERIKLTAGQLFLPEGFRPAGAEVPLTLHLHGAYRSAERNHVQAGQPGVLVTVVLPGLSAVYRDHFKDPAAFSHLLEEAAGKLRERFGKQELQIGPVTLTSFSAGFGGVREILADPASFERISTLVMADSLYAGFTGNPEERQVDPAHLEVFLRFAQEAVAGRKRFLLTHTQLFTPTYASTVETADYLVRETGVTRTGGEADWPGGLRQLGSWRKGRFEVLSFSGDDGPAHIKHLHTLWAFLRRVRLPQPGS